MDTLRARLASRSCSRSTISQERCLRFMLLCTLSRKVWPQVWLATESGNIPAYSIPWPGALDSGFHLAQSMPQVRPAHQAIDTGLPGKTCQVPITRDALVSSHSKARSLQFTSRSQFIISPCNSFRSPYIPGGSLYSVIPSRRIRYPGAEDANGTCVSFRWVVQRLVRW